MGKAPAFQFYANDFMDATRFWDANACGLYIRCMCIQWTQGAIPADLKVLARGLGCDLEELQDVWPTLSPKFVDVGGGMLQNPRLEASRVRKDEISAKRSEAANARWGGHANASANGHAKKMQRKMKIEDEVEEEEEGIDKKARAKVVTTKLDYEGFRARCLEVHKERSILSDNEAKAFFDYWTEGHPETKPRYAAMDKFDIAKRMATWKRNNFTAKADTPVSPTAKPWV
jgi:uncharacterized protein YdaU (DUF1376 family)